MRVYITCTNSDRVSMEYKELASNIASILAKRGHKLIFNGYDTGMIGKAFLTFKFDEAHTKAIVDIKDSDNLEVLDIEIKVQKLILNFLLIYFKTKNFLNI